MTDLAVAFDAPRSVYFEARETALSLDMALWVKELRLLPWPRRGDQTGQDRIDTRAEVKPGAKFSPELRRRGRVRQGGAGLKK